MPANQTSAKRGYEIFRAAEGVIARSELNERLQAQGLRPVSDRMMEHYRSLLRYDRREYVSINAFDQWRKNNPLSISTVVISAPKGFNLRELAARLQALDLDVQLSGQGAGVGLSGLESVRTQMSHADAAIGIITSDVSHNTMFEMGIAVGLNKRVLLAVERSAMGGASDLFWTQRVDFEPGRLDPIVDAVRRMRAPATEDRPKQSRQSKPQPAHLEVTDVSTLGGAAFEQVVAELIERTGAEVYRADAHADDGLDLAVWDSALEPALPNPLLVEIKLALRPDPLASMMFAERLLRETGGQGVALLVYRDGPPSSDLGFASAAVLPMRFDELVDEVAQDPFHLVVRRRRNQAAHGFPR